MAQKKLAETLGKMNRILFDAADECEKIGADDDMIGAGLITLGINYLIAAQIHAKFESARKLLDDTSEQGNNANH